jgi:hypothetical protein
MNATEFDYKYDDSSEEDSKRKSKTNEDKAQKSTLETISYQPPKITPENRSSQLTPNVALEKKSSTNNNSLAAEHNSKSTLPKKNLKRKSKTNEDEAQKSTLETRSHQPSTNIPLNKSSQLTPNGVVEKKSSSTTNSSACSLNSESRKKKAKPTQSDLIKKDFKRLTKNLDKFKKSFEIKPDKKLWNYFILSFITHWFGNNLLYSTKVNKQYKKHKQIKLKGKIGPTYPEYKIWKEKKWSDFTKRKTYKKDILFDLSKAQNFVAEFLVMLRVFIRSDKRRIRNGKNNNLDPEMKLLRIHKNVYIQTIYCKNKSKIENVLFFKTIHEANNFEIRTNDPKERLTYTQFFKKLSKNSLKILLAKRINIVQDDIKFENDYQKNIFMALWYTIFGVEVSRNPATLIHFNMFLDLIQAGKISWRKLFVYFPMSESDIVVKAKWLNELYNDFMPHKHKYDYDTRKSVRIENRSIEKDQGRLDLITREAYTTKEWLKFKLNLDGKEAEDFFEDCSKLQTLETMHKTKYESLNGWKLEGKIPCDQCNRLFKEGRSMAIHKATHKKKQ